MTTYDYRILATSASFGAGTGTISATGTALTGSGTAFTTQLAPGALIKPNGYDTVCVTSITNNTTATLQVAPVSNFSGVTFTFHNLLYLYNVGQASTIPSVITVPVVWPRSIPKLWPLIVPTGDGLQRGLGRNMTAWHWDFLSQAMRDSLRGYTGTSAASVSVYIRTRMLDNSDAYQTFLAAMLWPLEENRQTTRRIPFDLAFRNLVLM